MYISSDSTKNFENATKEILIRIAAIGDEKQIASVHINCWQEAYRDLLPAEFLNSLSDEIIEREKMWVAILNNPKRWAWVAQVENQVIGFILFGPPRDEGRENFIELGAIYLLEKYKGYQIGYRLLREGFKRMKELGCSKCYCWMLEGNPTLAFYKRTGGIQTKFCKQDEIGGRLYNEIAIEWPSLDL